MCSKGEIRVWDIRNQYVLQISAAVTAPPPWGNSEFVAVEDDSQIPLCWGVQLFLVCVRSVVHTQSGFCKFCSEGSVLQERGSGISMLEGMKLIHSILSACTDDGHVLPNTVLKNDITVRLNSWKIKRNPK